MSPSDIRPVDCDQGPQPHLWARWYRLDRQDHTTDRVDALAIHGGTLFYARQLKSGDYEIGAHALERGESPAIGWRDRWQAFPLSSLISARFVGSPRGAAQFIFNQDGDRHSIRLTDWPAGTRQEIMQAIATRLGPDASIQHNPVTVLDALRMSLGPIIAVSFITGVAFLFAIDNAPAGRAGPPRLLERILDPVLERIGPVGILVIGALLLSACILRIGPRPIATTISRPTNDTDGQGK